MNTIKKGTLTYEVIDTLASEDIILITGLCKVNGARYLLQIKYLINDDAVQYNSIALPAYLGTV